MTAAPDAPTAAPDDMTAAPGEPAEEPHAPDGADHSEARRERGHADEGTEETFSHPVVPQVMDRLRATAAPLTFHYGKR